MKRRVFLQRSAALTSLSFAGFASAQDQGHSDKPRLLVVLLRGGMDGLTAVPPVGDSLYNSIRPQIAIQKSLRLNADFGLHPQLEGMHTMWQAGQLAVVHSTGFQYTGRSHFEGQDIMQTGVMKPYASSSGWIGRAMEQAKVDSGVAISIPMPLILRGHDKATTQFPNWMPTLSDQDLAAVASIWAKDPILSAYTEVIREANLDKTLNSTNRVSFQNNRSMQGLARTAAASMR